MTTKLTWTKGAAIVAVIAGVLSLRSTAASLALNDPMPWAGISRVNDSGNRIEARIVRGNILGMWRAKCEYRRAGNIALAQNVDEQIVDLQADYVRLTGLPLQLQTCP